ncbi:hypothetical protein [Streptomyces sp. NPDC097981]|uniref:hypothetical protein n=1 Tax=Streptomyces sp. NPDC097981 TaxID=3155428 RepID=UPI003325322D
MKDKPAAPDFELLDVGLLTGEDGETVIHCAEDREVIELTDGTVVTLALVFRLGRDTDGLAYTETRLRDDGLATSPSVTHLGGFRAGGPYEVRLPPEHLPSGPAACCTYEVHGAFTDRRHRTLATVGRRYRIAHSPGHEGLRAA